jgi:hypothetical protein
MARRSGEMIGAASLVDDVVSWAVVSPVAVSTRNRSVSPLGS